MIWTLYGDGKTLLPGEMVAPNQRLSWPRTAGLGAQHVIAMFGGTFIFPILLGLSPQLALMMSGVATIVFLLMVKGHVPSYLGTSAAFIASVAAIRAQGGNSASVTGAILGAGAILLLVGVTVHFWGSAWVGALLPPAVTGAVVMLIGFSLAPVAAVTYMQRDPWVALITMSFVILASVLLPGFLSRIAIFLGLVFGVVLSWVLDTLTGPITTINSATGAATSALRLNLEGVVSAPWIGLPPASVFSATGADISAGWHLPSFNAAFILLVVPAVIALVAENAGHVVAVGEMTGSDLRPYIGRGLMGDGLGTVMSAAVGGSPTTTYAENIGVMAATRVYSTAAYVVAAAVAFSLGLSPKVGAFVSATPGGVLAGITLVLYGSIGLLGAKIWKQHNVDLSSPANLAPLGAGLTLGIGGGSLIVSEGFTITGISLGTLVVIGFYHLLRWVRPDLRSADEARESSAGGVTSATGKSVIPE